MSWEFERVAGSYEGVADGPAWDGQALFFSLVDESKILRYEPDSGSISEFRKYTARTKGLAFDPRGDLVGAQAVPRRLVRFNRDGTTIPLEARLDGEFHNFPDDLFVDRRGRIWFSDPSSPEPGSGPQHPPLDHASVLRWERGPDRLPRIVRLSFDTTWPRGVLLSPDEQTVYVADGGPGADQRRELRAYPITEEGELGAYRVLAVFGSDTGGAHRGVDGMCLDSDGNILACAGSASAGAGPAIYVFSPSGRILDMQPMPEEPTNCAFGDADLGTLYVTTAVGSLYRVRDTGRRGYPLWPLTNSPVR